MKKIGTVWFDDEMEAKEGWASDGETVYRINGYGDLSSDILWITNVRYLIWKKLALDNTPNIMHSQYMRITIEYIGKELGIIFNIEKLVLVSAKTYNNVYIIGNNLLDVNIKEPGYRYTNLLSDKVHESFMKGLPLYNFRERLLNAFKESTQENQAMSNKKAPSGSSVYSFIFPRGSYAKWLLSMPVPSGNNWIEIKRKTNSSLIGTREGNLIKGTKAVLKKLSELAKTKAIFLEIVIKYTDKYYREFATYGTGSNHMRGWATYPEILMLSKFCTIELNGGFMCDLTNLSINNKFVNNLGEYSYSSGVFLDNLWVALSTPKFKSPYTAVGAYLRAYDRFMCFNAVEKLALEDGYVIGSYGAGRIQIYLREGQLEECSNKCLELKLLPPLYIKDKKGDNNE